MQQQGFDINVLRQEAQKRWLKPSEVFFILQNYEQFPLTHEAPQKPPSGSLFLFNRRVLRFFRKDGHMWRRKRDGRSVGEAHERLKVDNVDALNCYYAHGEQNPYFQRRSYWMLDRAYEHIVLVHYREVAEGRYVSASVSNLPTQSCLTFNQSASISTSQFQGYTSRTTELHEPYRTSCSPGSAEEVSSKFVMENFQTEYSSTMGGSENHELSSQPEVNQALRRLELQLSLDDDDDYTSFRENLPSSSNLNDQLQHLRNPDSETKEFLHMECTGHGQVEKSVKHNSYSSIQSLKISDDHQMQQNKLLGLVHNIERRESPSWKDMLELSSSSVGSDAQGTSDFLAVDSIPDSTSWRASALGTAPLDRDTLNFGRDTVLSSSEIDNTSVIPCDLSEKLTLHKAENRPKGNQISESLQLSATRRFLLGSDGTIESPLSATRGFLLGSDDTIESPTLVSKISAVEEHRSSGISSLEANNLLRKENSSEWMRCMDLPVGKNTYSSDFSGAWFACNHLESSPGVYSSLTVAQMQRFSIRDISPEWAFSFESTKVIITGDFLCNPSECSWAVMFGDIEVPLEIIQNGVLRCQAPQHSAGKVTLCITSGNRESCSEVREFEFCAKPNVSNFVSNTSLLDCATKSAEELRLLATFVQMLLCGSDSSAVPVDIYPEVAMSSKKRTTNSHLQQITEALQVGCENPFGTIDLIMQELLKDKFQHWLSAKDQANELTGCQLSKQDQGIIHLIAGLGYEWALNPILNTGVSINFRDGKGWTALHWAAHFGREKMVAALLAAGASAGAVTDPTPQDPVGETPGSIASARGHKGIAGYLSEVALTSHLSSLTMEESEISRGSAAVEAERAVESLSQRSMTHDGGTEDELSLKDSLAAVRNAFQAAARIQAAFRAHSFRKRQQKVALSQDGYNITQEEIHGLSSALKVHRSWHGCHEQKFDKAALSIQRKYRGWKGRRDFLALRHHVVKIQAHVRGYQVRKKYKELLWTVSVVEKVVLRWRRRGVGLRGFRAEPEPIDEGEEDDIAKVFRKQKVDAALEKAMSRVLSMVDSPDARQQYRRMLERYREAKAESSNVDEATSRINFGMVEDEDFMY